MTNDEKKPKADDGPAATATPGFSPADQGRADRSMQTDNGNSAREAVVDAVIDQRIQNHLGRKLKEAYDDLVQQPVPDKFHKLLEELERQEKKQ